MNPTRSIVYCALAGLAAFTSSVAVAAADTPNSRVEARLYSTGIDRHIPLMNWKVDQTSAQQTLSAAQRPSKLNAKAATDLGSIFRPLAPCRVVDTRGNGAPIQGGAFAPNTRRTMVAGGICGIPTGNVLGVSITLVTFNHTPATGGFISVLAPAAPITGTNDIFNFGSQWSGTTVIAPSDGTGSFDVYVSQATADVIIDVNGYFQDLNFVDINTEMDIGGTTTGDLLQLFNNDTGSTSTTLTVAHGGPVGKSLVFESGGMAVAGLGIGGPQFVTVHKVDTSNNFGAGSGTLCSGFFNGYSIIDNPYSNGDPNAVLFVTPVQFYGGISSPTHADNVYAVYYINPGNGCANSGSAANHWAIIKSGGTTAFTNGELFNVMVIKP